MRLGQRLIGRSVDVMVSPRRRVECSRYSEHSTVRLEIINQSPRRAQADNDVTGTYLGESPEESE